MGIFQNITMVLNRTLFYCKRKKNNENREKCLKMCPKHSSQVYLTRKKNNNNE